MGASLCIRQVCDFSADAVLKPFPQGLQKNFFKSKTNKIINSAIIGLKENN